jgi:hypothetical protein
MFTRNMIAKCLALIIVALVSSGAFAKDFSFSGHESNSQRKSTLKFSISADGSIKGTQSIDKVCETNVKMSGAQLTFTGSVSGGYPQANGSFTGTSYHCNGKSSPNSGSIAIGYHPQFGVFVQLFAGDGSTEWWHKPASNPF